MSDVGACVLAKRRVIPKDVVTLSVSPFACVGWFVPKCVVVSSFVECLLVRRSGLVKGCFVGWEAGRFAYRMIRLQVDSPTLKTIRLHVLRCFAYTEVNSPTRSEMLHLHRSLLLK